MSKMKLSIKDKNLVAMSWLAEIILKSLVDCEKNSTDKVPDYKKKMYADISKRFELAHQESVKLNDEFNEQINKVFTTDFQDVLCDLTLSIVLLYETMSPEQVLNIMRASGIRQKDIIDNFTKKEEKEDEKENQ